MKFTLPWRTPKPSAPPPTEPVDYISTTLQVKRTLVGGTYSSTVTLDLPLDTPFDKLDTIIKPIIDPNSTTGVPQSSLWGQSLTFA